MNTRLTGRQVDEHVPPPGVGFYANLRVWEDPEDSRPLSDVTTEREVVNENFGRLLQSLFGDATQNAEPTVTLTDTSGATVTDNLDGFMDTVNTVSNPAEVGYGDGAGTPAKTDDEISGLIAKMDASSQTLDEANGKFDIQGSRIHTEAGTTITRLGLYLFVDKGGTDHEILIDHATVGTPPSVATNDTVDIKYTIDY